MKRTRALIVGIGAVVLAACQVIAGIDRVDKVQSSGEGEDGGPVLPGTSSGVIPANDPCAHVRPPAPPAKTDEGVDLPPLYLATKTLSLTKPADNGLFGFDLDQSCTCNTGKGTSFDGGPSCKAPGTPLCDTDGGVDNQGAVLFRFFQTASQQDLDVQFNDSARGGTRTIMLYIDGWNGKPNDLDISVNVFVSHGSVTDPSDLKFDGTDVWSYPKTVANTNGALTPLSTVPGYVSDGRLVVQKAGKVTILFGGTGLGFGDAVISGDLKKEGTGPATFVGVVGGRIPLTDLLISAAVLQVNGTGELACQSTLWPLISGQICKGADIPTAFLSDFTGADCNAVSSAIAINAVQASVGGTMSVDPLDMGEPSPCSPGQPSAPSGGYKCN